MLKIFLMTKNEKHFIEDWIKYHGFLFGLSNIFIIDGSDDEYVIDIYSKYINFGLNVIYSTSRLNDICDVINMVIHENKGDDNFLIKLDTDEFLAYTEPFFLGPHNAFDKIVINGCLKRRGGILRDLFYRKYMDRKHANKKIMTKDIVGKFAELPVTGQRYKASLTTWSLPSVENKPRPCISSNDFTSLQFTHVKSFFHSSSFVSVDLGCHGGVSTVMGDFLETGLTVVHYHNISVEDSLRKARQVLISHGYIQCDEVLEVQRANLVKLKESNVMASIHKIDLYLVYLESQLSGKSFPASILNEYHPYFRSTGISRKLNIIADTLSYIDEICYYQFI